MNYLQDPYKDVPSELKVRINADVPAKDKILINSVIPFRGVMQAMVNTFVKAVVDEMRENNLTHYDERNYDEFIAIIRRRTAPGPANPQSRGNGPGGTDGVRAEAPNPTNVSPDTAKQSGGRRPGGRERTNTKKKVSAKD